VVDGVCAQYLHLLCDGVEPAPGCCWSRAGMMSLEIVNALRYGKVAIEELEAMRESRSATNASNRARISHSAATIGQEYNRLESRGR
jgi:hypothetical protein